MTPLPAVGYQDYPVRPPGRGASGEEVCCDIPRSSESSAAVVPVASYSTRSMKQLRDLQTLPTRAELREWPEGGRQHLEAHGVPPEGAVAMATKVAYRPDRFMELPV